MGRHHKKTRKSGGNKGGKQELNFIPFEETDEHVGLDIDQYEANLL